MSDYEEGKKSQFNAGIAQTERLDALQRAINAAHFNPIQRNIETGTFNYEIIIAANDSLAREASAKADTEEKKQIERIQAIIKKQQEIKPVITIGRGNEMKLNKDSYQDLLTLIEIYGRLTKQVLDAHNMDNPNAEEEGYF